MIANRIRSLVSPRFAFGVVFVTGMSLCTRGIAQAPVRGWLHPVSLLGYFFGALALLLGILVLFRKYPGPLQNDRSALFALTGLIIVKFILAGLYPLIP